MQKYTVPTIVLAIAKLLSVLALLQSDRSYRCDVMRTMSYHFFLHPKPFSDNLLLFAK